MRNIGLKLICRMIISMFMLTEPLAIAQDTGSVKDESVKPLVPQKLPQTPKNIISVQSVEGDSSQKLSIVTVRLDRNPNWQNLPLESHGTFIQVILPDTIVAQPGAFYEGKSPFISKIGVFQLSPTQTAIRLFLTEEADKIKNATTLDILGDRIIFSLDHRAVGGQSQESPAITKETTDKKPIPTAPGFTIPEKWQKHLVPLTWFFAVFFALAIIMIVMKNNIKTRVLRHQKREQMISMDLLDSLSLNPKQKLQLVQIGGEKILLSVSSDQVQLITRIESEKPIPMVQKAFSRIPPTEEKIDAQKAHRDPKLPSLGQTPQKPLKLEKPESQKPPPPNKGKRINVSISDDGITQQKTRQEQEKSFDEDEIPIKHNDEPNIDDVTKLIREKLKNLPKL